MNCRRTQSILSAYIDGELTGEDMMGIRRHLSACEFCSDELESLQIVKRLLGSLDAVDASKEWSSNIVSRAYAGNRPWWEKAKNHDTFFVQFSRNFESGSLSPRGTRMVRALALSTVFVFLAAVPSSFEKINPGVTGRIAATMGGSFLPWSVNQSSNVQSLSSFFQPNQDPRVIGVDPVTMSSNSQYNVQSASAAPSFAQPNWSSGNGLTFVSTAHN